MNAIASDLIKAAAIITLFFGQNAWASAVSTFLTNLAVSLTGDGGTIPAFRIGTATIGPIPVVISK